MTFGDQLLAPEVPNPYVVELTPSLPIQMFDADPVALHHPPAHAAGDEDSYFFGSIPSVVEPTSDENNMGIPEDDSTF